MLKCKRCDSEVRDGVQCTVCKGHYDYACAGIPEAGYRKPGDRKYTWKCATCKNPASPLLPTPKTSSDKSPSPTDLESIMLELKQLTAQTASIPKLMQNMEDIKSELVTLKTRALGSE